MTTLQQPVAADWSSAAGALGDLAENEQETDVRRPVKRKQASVAVLSLILILGPVLAGAIVLGYGIIRFKWLG